LSGHYASIYTSQQDANLVLSALRHQRDLFSGGPALGIPDVNTHVGSVIHAFENLAYQRQIKEGAEMPYESSKSSSTAEKKDSIYKINLPPPSKNKIKKISNDIPKQIVRHRPKGKAPDVPFSSSAGNTISATTQTTKFSGDENESSALDSLNLEEENYSHNKNNKFPQSYIKKYKVFPPSRIPTKKVTKLANQLSTRNQTSDSSLQLKTRTDVFLKPKKYSEDDIENDFLRGTTVSQSFIKNVVRKSPTIVRKISTYEQNFLFPDNSTENSEIKIKKKSRSSSSKLEQPFADEVSLRYKEYSSNNDISSSRNHKTRQSFQPRRIDRAEL
jgi:hypothetical protein